jgi:hypothetical protein
MYCLVYGYLVAEATVKGWSKPHFAPRSGM